jgi:hypothetical protein
VVMARDLAYSWRLMTLEPRRVHAKWIEDQLAVDVVELLARDLLDQDPGHGVPGVRILEALPRREVRREMRCNVVDEFEWIPGPIGFP